MSHSSLSTPTPATLVNSTAISPQTPPRTPPSTTSTDKPSISSSNGLFFKASAVPSHNSQTLASVISHSSSPVSPKSTSSSPESSLASSAITSSSLSPAPKQSAFVSPVLRSTFSPTRSTSRSTQCTPTPSPSLSQYKSPFPSPNTSTTFRRGHLEDGGLEEAETLMRSLGLGAKVNSGSEDSILQSAATATDNIDPPPTTTTAVACDSPVLPSLSPTSPAFIPNAPTLIDIHHIHTTPTHPKPTPTLNSINMNAPTLASDSTPQACPTSHSVDNKTPNVYINGLPAQFPEDQLFALASPFGAVRSVRSFTRHVGERASGYGFVLFETIESAEKCIESLRRYRNLHPSFSKQVHKIPGTAYALSPSPGPTSSSASSLNGWEQEDTERNETFRVKMERLQDETSTNLYIEGLPLSIDEPTLAALVSPYGIKSSRFFQTKLSHPPRIIAFVRLETRSAAEEIIERLHGRMVRGWNDSGSRISVRFADTSEQRELRRTERSHRDDEQSPARLTIAEAALLNLRGQELRSQAQGAPVIHARPPAGPVGFGEYARPQRNDHSHQGEYRDFSSNAHISSTGLAVDYTHVNAGDFARRSSARVHTPSPYQQYPPLPVPGLGHHAQDINPAMSALLDSLRGNGAPFAPNNAYNTEASYPHVRDRHLPALRNSRGYGDANLDMMYSNQQHTNTNMNDAMMQMPMLGQAQARNGFTPAEEIILQAHANTGPRGRRLSRVDATQARREAEDANITMGVRGYRAQASAISFPQQQQQTFSPMSSMEPLPQMSEEDFHAAPTQYRQYRRQHGDESRSVAPRPTHNHNIHPAHVNARLSRDLDSIQQQQQQQQQQQTPISSYPSEQASTHNNHNQQAHMRSTTLPHRSSSASQHQRHHQYSSMSIPNSSNISTSTRTNQTQQISNPHSIIKNTYGSSNSIYEPDSTASKITNSSIMRHNTDKNYSNNYDSHAHFSRPHTFRDSDVHELDSSSPPLVSPALTYSSRSPATLSPATPFFGSFGHAGEGFEGPAHGVESKKLRSGSQ